MQRIISVQYREEEPRIINYTVGTIQDIFTPYPFPKDLFFILKWLEEDHIQFAELRCGFYKIKILANIKS